MKVQNRNFGLSFHKGKDYRDSLTLSNRVRLKSLRLHELNQGKTIPFPNHLDFLKTLKDKFLSLRDHYVHVLLTHQLSSKLYPSCSE